MKLLFLILLPLNLLASTEGLISFISKPSAEVSLCTEDDPYQKCAEDLCGPPNQHQSMSLQDYNFELYLSKEGLKSIPQVKADLEKFLEAKIAQTKKHIEELNQKKNAGTLLPDFKELSTAEWNQLAVSIYQTHLGFNPFDGSEVKTNVPVDASVTRGLKDFAEAEGACTTKACQEGVKNYLTDDLYGRKLQELTLKISSPNLFKERLPYCLSSYASTALKKNQQAKMEKQFPIFVEQYINNALKDYSAHSKEVFRKYVKESLTIKYEEPGLTSEEYLDEVKKLSSKSFAGKSDLDSMMQFRVSRSGIDPLSAIGSVCPGSFASVGGDVFLPQGADDDEKSALFISLGSQMNPSSGEGVLYHELSHALSHVFGQGLMSKSSLEEFKKLRKCVKSLSPLDPDDANNIVPPHEGDHRCTEEDAADITSYKAMGASGGALMECSLLRQTSDKSSYEKLDMKEHNAHSAKLVRILREAIHRNRTITPACQKVISSHKNEYNFKKCF